MFSLDFHFSKPKKRYILEKNCGCEKSAFWKILILVKFDLWEYCRIFSTQKFRAFQKTKSTHLWKSWKRALILNLIVHFDNFLWLQLARISAKNVRWRNNFLLESQAESGVFDQWSANKFQKYCGLRLWAFRNKKHSQFRQKSLFILFKIMHVLIMKNTRSRQKVLLLLGARD